MSCLPGNITCNFEPGSPNFFSGGVEYVLQSSFDDVVADSIYNRQSSYNYLLNRTAAIVFVVFFGLSSALHLGQAVWSRQWWLIYTLFCGAVGRLWSSISEHWDPSAGGFYTVNDTSFLMQISSLIIAPAFMAAGNYILLGRIIPVLGTKYSFIHPLSYTIVFVLGDLVSLVVQAIGGGKASAAETLDAVTGANAGAKVMVGGVLFQMAVMIGYSIVLLAYVIRYKTDRPISPGRQINLFTWWPNALRPKSQKKAVLERQVTGRAYNGSVEGLGEPQRSERLMSGGSGQTGLLEKGEKGSSRVQDSSPRQMFGEDRVIAYTEREIRGARILLWACAASTLLIFIRSVYRSIELLDGWEGAIMKKQTLFDLLDGMLMLLSVLLFNIVHPGWFLPRHERVVGNAA
ncbi:hypothetical protein QFC20_001291 [Naganishia adeliensis]|uniref:Uncharacterized protein n=1 Tax=Naganishia adeliensis TaxID=92952 RepID=A0ACC2WTZ8_9TREE|nr:hypothetical protein QFC20_001291 [Naganishia adeliensis]